MKNNRLIFKLFLFIGITLCSCNLSKNAEYPALEKLFLNQKPANAKPEIFALGLVSSENQEHSSLAFSPDGTELWWSLWPVPYDLDKKPQRIKYMRFENGKWSKAQIAPFSGKFRDGSPAFSPNGKRIYFYSRRPLTKENNEMHNNDIWYIEKTADGWGEAINLGEPINTSFVEAAPTLAANGNLYFVSNRNQYENPTGNNDIFISIFEDGKFAYPISISDSINTNYARESFPFIAPDESYIIFSRDSRQFDEEGHFIDGDRKLMISFRDKKGIWRNPIEMGKDFYKARFPSVSPDQKHLFFTKYSENTSEDFYWVDAKIIEDLKPKYLN